jgi:hypothetical protein
VNGDTPVSAPPGAVLPPEIAEDAARLVGLTEAEAERMAVDAGWGFRVVERDGEGLARTDDLRLDRVNVVVTGGVVTAVEIY